MRKTELRRKSKKPRPHKSKTALADYCDRFDFDEPLFWLGLRLTERGIRQEHVGIVDQGGENDPKRRLELNHVWSMHMRPDLRSNFCRMLKEGHDWFGSHLPEGRTICVLTKLVKMAKLGEPEEFILGEIFRVFGKHVSGVISGYDFAGDELMQRLQAECLKRLAELERT